MKTPSSTVAARLYAGTSLFAAAYAPLALIFALRLMAKSHPLKALLCVVISFVAAGNLVFMLKFVRPAPQRFAVCEIESGSGEMAAYVATYILPFIVVSDVTNWDLAAYVAYILILAIISIRGDWLHLNPLLAIRGYRLYTITTESKRRWLALSIGRLAKDDQLEASVLWHRFLLVTENRSAVDRSTSED